MTLALDLPVDATPPLPPPRMTADQYLEFVEFNQRVLQSNDQWAQLIARQTRPVEEMFCFPPANGSLA
jgi:hypothetical protein